jgi:hypothetical protein
LADKISTVAPQAQVQVQLHWCEYFQAKWSDRISTDINDYPPINVFDGFDPDNNAYIHVAKETTRTARKACWPAKN